MIELIFCAICFVVSMLLVWFADGIIKIGNVKMFVAEQHLLHQMPSNKISKL
jgi:hypothetical protein